MKNYWHLVGYVYSFNNLWRQRRSHHVLWDLSTQQPAKLGSSTNPAVARCETKLMKWVTHLATSRKLNLPPALLSDIDLMDSIYIRCWTVGSALSSKWAAFEIVLRFMWPVTACEPWCRLAQSLYVVICCWLFWLLWTRPHFCLPQFVGNFLTVDTPPSCVPNFNDSTACLMHGLILFFWKASVQHWGAWFTWKSLKTIMMNNM